MLRDATTVMILGMGTVFIVLLALLGMMTLGGLLAQRLARHGNMDEGGRDGGAAGHGGDAVSGAADGRQSDIAVAIAAARCHRARREKATTA